MVWSRIFPLYLLILLSCSHHESVSTDKENDSANKVEIKSDFTNLPFSIYIPVENDSLHLTIAESSSTQTRILLTKSNQPIVSKSISLTTFSEGLNTIKTDSTTKMSIQYNFIRSNRLYFLAKLYSQYNSKVDTIRFAIFFRTAKKGELTYW